MLPQTTQIGPGTLAGLGAIITRLNARTAMLVTGGVAYLASGARDLVEPALERSEVIRFSGVSANPKIAEVERGVSLWRVARPAMIVAIGGGSVLDVAKLVGLLGPGTASCDALFKEGHVLGHVDVPRRPMTVIAIPTTAGSGAEATRFATLYVSGEKHSIAHPLLRPSHAIVDPLLTVSMPPALAAATGLDALAQAIESLWAVGATPQSQALAAAALGEILPCIADLVRSPTMLLRERMARGAHLAGRAIDLSRTTAAHALSYALTADLGVPHGHAVAMVLPSIFRINARPDGRRIQEPRGADYLSATIDRILRLLDCRDGEAAARFLQGLMGGLGLAPNPAVRTPGVSAASLAGRVNAERLNNNPVALSAADVLDIYAGLLNVRGVG